ncbi:unnamed protein product [Blepharisma stoltei]|uniref:USP domain-containing protein n=1 Tax=Blepharisma stoltei TaxID=1481888 RepID=A0AAU9ICH5_9CILI|nr:unnamed protein product [Blepharisma stoltei]
MKLLLIKISNFYEAMETNKLLQEKLKDLEEKNKISNSQALYDPENEIIKLLPNRKHGLPNFGNTCYLNSLLQIFASTPLLARKVESINSPFCNSLYLLLDSMFKDNSLKTIRNLTQDFRQNLMATYSNIEAYNQQDAKEVFNMILSKIEEDGGNLDLFSIGFHQEFICKTMLKHRSEYHDIQIFLIIPPCHKDSVENYLYYLGTYYNSTQKLICSECKREVNTSIQLKKVDWPDYLILYFPTPPDRITDSIRINYEIIYEMYGAICYYQDEGSFHYTAFTRDENEWNEYNDEHVETKKIDPHVINLAFYCRKTYSRPIYSR